MAGSSGAGRGVDAAPTFLQRPMRVSIIIPALDEIDELPATVAGLQRLRPAPAEVIVADGGSVDGTREWLEQHADGEWLRFVETARGRGTQMNAAAALASGDVLLLLHADAVLPGDALERVARALASPNTVGGAFTIRFARRASSPRSMPLIGFGISARTVLTRTATGDQAIFARRERFAALGGFRPWPLFEDVDFVTRLKRHGGFAIIKAPVTISDRRYATFGPWITTFLMYRLRLRYWLGASPDELKRVFADVRGASDQPQGR